MERKAHMSSAHRINNKDGGECNNKRKRKKADAQVVIS